MKRSSQHLSSRDRRSTTACIAKRALLGGSIAAVLLAPSASHAQTDVTPALPNVLILLDSSGSMERFPNATLPTVAPWATSTEKNRWVSALEVLGGALDNYKLLHEPRVAGDFFNEYNLGGALYDLNYSIPHFRPLSNDCGIGPTGSKTWPNDWTTWGTSSFGFRKWSGASLGVVGSCGVTDYRSDGLGILDTFKDQARFALMTFDTATDPKTGWDGVSHLPVDGMAGTYSYFPGWNGGGPYSPAYGWPAGCSVDPGSLASHVVELGARNPAAPPWEGPLVPFALDDTTTSLRAVNDRIRYAMLAMRPFGATPLAPMLADAQHYLWNDPAGPKIDPSAACRGNFIILITDGFPNSDLRPQCENSPDPKAASVWPACNTTTGGGGCCPAKRAQDIAYDLAHPTDLTKPPVQTFVVGFALSDDTGAPVDCSTIDPTSTTCSSPTLDPRFKPCCTLHEIAFNGGTNRALLATDTTSLRTALVEAMSKATAKTSTSRTVPVFSGTVTGGQYEFRSSFKVNTFGPWTGILERVRWLCNAGTGPLGATPTPVDKSLGDDYATNLSKMTSRNFLTYDAAAIGLKSTDTLRPNLPTSETDGILSAVPPLVLGSGPAFVNSVSAAMMNITTPCADTASADECRTKLMNYALALPQPRTTWLSRSGLPLADIYHATPVSVGPPRAFLRDESYTLFRNNPTISTRIPFLLTATNDGLLHAFKSNVVTDSDPEAELYGFIPPAVLASLGAQYGGAHALLLDAAPIVKDVAFGLATSTRPWGRTGIDARGGNGNWKSIAVGALTAGSGGYYALDVTDSKNPRMLWQLTKYKEAGTSNPPAYDLFGQSPGTPAIGTIYIDDGGVKVETPVAFLPGGSGYRFQPGKCNRWPRTSSSALPSTNPVTTARQQVGCWAGPGNSFTIVRLWDGKILKTFRNNPAPTDGIHPPEPNSATARWAATGKAAGLILDSAGTWPTIDSPITGAVGLSPGALGTVTTRAFVGDNDGTLWKADVSDPNPVNWTFAIFHDAYFPSDAANAVQAGWGPVAIPPVLSVDRFGDVVVNYATGDQNNFSTVNLNHVYSLTERTTISTTGAKSFVPTLNWHIKLSGGNTPTGPMSLFGGDLFFSTFTPTVATVGACLSGRGTIWAVDYLETEDRVTNDDLTPIPRGRHRKTSTSETPAAYCPPAIANGDARTGFGSFFRCIVLDPGTIVFGAGITQRPSCVTEATSGTGIDPYTGATTSHSAIGDMSVGEFQLVAQTGPSGAAATGGVTKTYTRTLVPPTSTTRIDSWAAIVE